MKKIGLLGGMGPVATQHIFGRILFHCQKKFGSIQDTEYPQILIDSISLEDFNEQGVTNHDLILSQLLTSIKNISTYGSPIGVIGIACNTVHIFYDALQSATTVPIIHLPKVVVDSVVQDGHVKVGILASQTSIEEGLYTSEMNKQNINYSIPGVDEQRVITQVIKSVMGGTHGVGEEEKLGSIISRFASEGCTAVIFGCTELPVGMDDYSSSIPIYSSNDILAQTLVSFACE